MSNSIPRFGLLFGLLFSPVFAAANPAQYVQWGTQMLQQKKYDDAMKYFNGAIKADPRNAAAYKGLGAAYYAKGDQARAKQYLQYAAQLDPNDAQTRQYLGMLGGSAAPAAGGASPADAHYANGVKYMQAKQYQYAAYYFNQATQADPSSAKSWQGLGTAFYQQGNRDKALAAWDRALALDPSNAQLAQYVQSIRGATSPSAEAAPTATAQAPSSSAPAGQAGMNPWVMGITVAALGGIMLFLF